MTLELVDTLSRFEALRAEWDALYRDDPAAHVFLSHRWLRDLYARRPGVCTFVWRERAPGAPLGAVLPLRRELVLDRSRRRFRGELMMAGNHWADYTGVLCRPGVESEALPALGEALGTLPWERLRLDSLRISETRLAALVAGFGTEAYAIETGHPRDNDGATRLDVAPRVPLPARFDDWLAGLGANTRQRLRRYRRRLEADPGLSIRTSVAATRAADLAAFRRLWLARWEEAKGRSAAVKADKYVAILADGLADDTLDGATDSVDGVAGDGRDAEASDERFGARSGHGVVDRADDVKTRLELLCAHGQPVAVAAVYDDPVHRTRAFYVGARDETFRTLPAGLVLHAHLIEQAIERGWRVYDLLRGDEPYKRMLGGQEETPLVVRTVRPTPPRPAHVMLDECHRDAALEMVREAHATARADTLGRLYSQLLESWPAEPRVLAAYRAWLDGAEHPDGAPSRTRSPDAVPATAARSPGPGR